MDTRNVFHTLFPGGDSNLDISILIACLIHMATPLPPWSYIRKWRDMQILCSKCQVHSVIKFYIKLQQLEGCGARTLLLAENKCLQTRNGPCTSQLKTVLKSQKCQFSTLRKVTSMSYFDTFKYNICFYSTFLLIQFSSIYLWNVFE